MFYQGKVVLVTGGTGFVGTHIVQELLLHGAKVRIPVHHRTPVVEDPSIETISADLTRQEDCLAVLKGVDCLFHAAGTVAAAGVAAKNLMTGITTNLVLTARMLEAACTVNVDRMLIFGSSTGYPDTDHPMKEEEMWTGPTHPAYFGYGWMRRYLERLGEFVCSKSSVKVMILRPTAIYGRWDNFDPNSSHVIPALIRRALDKEDPYVVWGTGDEVRDFLHVSDLARASLLVLEKCESAAPINIGYGNPVTIKDVVNEILSAACHEKAKVVFDASRPTTIPSRMVDITKARKLLAFEPKVSLEEGVRDTVAWYRDFRNRTAAVPRG